MKAQYEKAMEILRDHAAKIKRTFGGYLLEDFDKKREKMGEITGEGMSTKKL